MAEPSVNEDFVDLVAAFRLEGVEYLIVGAHALAVHGVPRATGDLDVLVRPTADNARRVMTALRRFGAPVAAHGVREADFATPGAVYQIGLPPRRIDVLTSISGVDFDTAWATRTRATMGAETVNVIGRDALLANKRASGRDKDLLDVRVLEEQRPRK